MNIYDTAHNLPQLAETLAGISQLSAMHMNGAADYAAMLPKVRREERNKIVRQIINCQLQALGYTNAAAQHVLTVAEAVEGR